MIAVKSSTPNMPKLEMVKVPPWYSSGLSLPSRARAASALVSAEIEARPLDPTFLMIGVMSPVGVATATQMSACLYLSCQRCPPSLVQSGSLSDNLAQPSRVGLGDVVEREGGSLDNCGVSQNSTVPKRATH